MIGQRSQELLVTLWNYVAYCGEACHINKKPNTLNDNQQRRPLDSGRQAYLTTHLTTEGILCRSVSRRKEAVYIKWQPAKKAIKLMDSNWQADLTTKGMLQMEAAGILIAATDLTNSKSPSFPLSSMFRHV